MIIHIGERARIKSWRLTRLTQFGRVNAYAFCNPVPKPGENMPDHGMHCQHLLMSIGLIALVNTQGTQPQTQEAGAKSDSPRTSTYVVTKLSVMSMFVMETGLASLAFSARVLSPQRVLGFGF